MKTNQEDQRVGFKKKVTVKDTKLSKARRATTLITVQY